MKNNQPSFPSETTETKYFLNGLILQVFIDEPIHSLFSGFCNHRRIEHNNSP